MPENENNNPFTKQVDLNSKNESEKNIAPENPFKHLEEVSLWKDMQDNKKPEKKKKKKVSIWAILFGIFILFLFLAILLIFILVIWWPNNPLLKLLWIQAATIQSSLLWLTNIIFSFFSILVFIFLTVWIFIRLLAKKEDKKRKKSWLILSLSSWWLLFITMAAWIWLYTRIESFEFKLNIKAEILTDPVKTDNIATPAIIKFSARQALFVSERRWKKIDNIRWDFDNDWSIDYHWIEPDVSHEFQISWQKRIIVIFDFKDWTSQKFEKFINFKEWSFYAKPGSWFWPLEVAFDASNLWDSSINSISEYRWFFKWWDVEDLITSKPKTKFIFEKIWEYEVRLVTSDNKNNIKTYTKKITVKPWWKLNILKPVITVSPWKEWIIPLKLKFSWEKSMTWVWEIISYKWDFWDLSEPLSWKTVIKEFKKEWEYEVVLTIENSSWVKKTQTEYIKAVKNEWLPVAKILTTPEILKWWLPFAVSFDASTSIDSDKDIVEYNWDFNDDWKTDLTWEKVDFIFREIWNFKISLTVIDSKWNKSIEFTEVNVVRKKQAIISLDKNSWEAPLVVSLDGSSTLIDKNDTIVNYYWDFWDWILEEFSSANKSHIYENPWSYIVKLIVSTNNWEVFESTKEIFVREVSLQSCFEASKTQWVVPTSIKFDSHCSRWIIETWKWDFWDWAISYQRSPIHKFKKPWKRTVILQITDKKNNVSKFETIINLK